MTTPPTTATPRRRVRGTIAGLWLLAVAGCYDGPTLVDRARNDALKSRIEAVDLGRYEITMPKSNGQHGMTEVQVEPFGRVARYKLANTEDLISENEYRLRHAVVLTIRSSDDEDFAEPDLAELRGRLLSAIHEAMDDRAIESIGFHTIRFIRH